MQRVKDGAHLLAAERLCGGQREQREEGAQQEKRRWQRLRARAAHGAQGVHFSGTSTRRGKNKKEGGEEEENRRRGCGGVELSESWRMIQ